MKQKKRISKRQKPVNRKLAGRKTIGRRSTQRKIAARKITGRRVAGLKASGDEKLQSAAVGPDEASRRPQKRRITLFLDADVLAWFKASGPRYQTRINQALWDVMNEERMALPHGRE
jgi:uncharacterized protein (DUF4415 family)